MLQVLPVVVASDLLSSSSSHLLRSFFPPLRESCLWPRAETGSSPFLCRHRRREMTPEVVSGVGRRWRHGLSPFFLSSLSLKPSLFAKAYFTRLPGAPRLLMFGAN
ncbi:hypothetical protein U1Q18_025808, partial [Sarracenia purpurea var. burkii]